MAGIRLTFVSSMLRVSPPWLRRIVGAAVMEGFGVPIDTETDRNTEGVELRFPNVSHPDALGFTGRERRILRGPIEPAASYIVRLRKWWDSHRGRGGPYALLNQLFGYFTGFPVTPMEVVSNTGQRHLIDTSGNITRDSIIWDGDGQLPTKWARIWVMINDATLAVPLLTESGEEITTESGETILIVVPITTLTPADEDVFCAVPREWSAAHIDEMHVVLLFGGAELWGYRTTDDPLSGGSIGTWDDSDPTPGQTWTAGAIDILC